MAPSDALARARRAPDWWMLPHQPARHCSPPAQSPGPRLVTQRYSTSFTLGIRTLHPRFHDPIYAIYGFVRCADEIVDTFEAYEQELLLDEFEAEYEKALERKINLNPVLNAFQKVVHQYELYDLVQPFMHSMRMDLSKKEYTTPVIYTINDVI